MSAAALLFLCSSASPAQAIYSIPSNIDLDGYAWSSTIGWISLNCATGGVGGTNICGTSNYKVTIASATGNLSGYAWSSNAGWIKFNGLSGFPVGAGTTAISARVATGSAYPNLTYEGWVRACAGTDSGVGTCTTMTNSTSSGGWDGWISLAGVSSSSIPANHNRPYAITSSNAAVSATSYAWGGSVVGWVSFDPVTLLVPGASLSAANCTIPLGGSACNSIVSWTFTVPSATNNIFNLDTNLSYFTASNTGVSRIVPLKFGTNRIQTRTGTSVLRQVSPLATCALGSDFSNGTSCQTTVAAAPTISIKITDGRTLVRVGETVPVSWTLSSPLDPAATCSLYGPGINRTVTTSGSADSSALKNPVLFKLICTGPFGSVEAAARVDVIPAMQEV